VRFVILNEVKNLYFDKNEILPAKAGQVATPENDFCVSPKFCLVIPAKAQGCCKIEKSMNYTLEN
jgi:hypothetical protein